MTLACGSTDGSKLAGSSAGSATTEDAGVDGSKGHQLSGSGGRSGHTDASTGPGARSSCATGDEGCPCYGNKTCNGGLTCASNLCVNLGGPDASSGGGGQSSTGGKSGAAGAGGLRSEGGSSGKGGSGGSSGASGKGGSGGASGGGGTGGAHQCFPDQTICNDDPAGCCLGLLCVSATGAPNAVCTPVCTRSADCSSGCCAPLDDGSAKVCAPPQYCRGSCVPAGGSCTSAVSSCCAGTLCVYDDATTSTASCAAVCDFDTDCVSGCCAPLADGSGSVCSEPSYCAGTCLAAGTRPCGLGTPCCPGSYCTADSQNQICLPLCSTNADCASGCCAVPNGNGVHVCTDRAFCP